MADLTTNSMKRDYEVKIFLKNIANAGKMDNKLLNAHIIYLNQIYKDYGV